MFCNKCYFVQNSGPPDVPPPFPWICVLFCDFFLMIYIKSGRAENILALLKHFINHKLDWVIQQNNIVRITLPTHTNY